MTLEFFPMNISRAQIQSHVAHTSRALHQAAAEAPGEFTHKVIADRSLAVDGFADKLERTPGATLSDIEQSSQARAASRSKLIGWAGGLLGGAVVVGTLVLGGPLGAGLLYGGGLLAGGVLGGQWARDNEDSFRKQLGNFAEEVSQGRPAEATSGVRVSPENSGLLTNDEWLMLSVPPSRPSQA